MNYSNIHFPNNNIAIKKIILYGIAAAILFSSTFVINRWLNVQEHGHWYWTASLRYIYVFLFLSIIIFFSNGIKAYQETLKCFFTYWYFWIFAGGVGFGLFYLSLCYAASYSAGWVLATTWQTTILITPIIILLLGNKVSSRGVIYLLIIFSGIILVNYQEFPSSSQINLKFIIPILFAAFCYPLGNTLCKYACEGRYSKIPIHQFPISKNIFSQIIMMTLGALPVLFLFWVFIFPPAPTTSQLYSTAYIALFTGVIATSLFYKARQLSGTNTFALSAADGTQAFEAPMALFCEWLFFNGLAPSKIGFLGLFFVIIGIFLFYHSKAKLVSTREINTNKS